MGSIFSSNNSVPSNPNKKQFDAAYDVTIEEVDCNVITGNIYFELRLFDSTGFIPQQLDRTTIVDSQGRALGDFIISTSGGPLVRLGNLMVLENDMEGIVMGNLSRETATTTTGSQLSHDDTDVTLFGGARPIHNPQDFFDVLESTVESNGSDGSWVRNM